MALLGSIRGTICIYQGEELGLTEADVPFERLRDPYGINFWPEFKGRDGCRTPMPWRASEKNAGFSTGEPWLPLPEDHLPLAVDRQESDPSSVLSAYRDFLRFRRSNPALISGSIRFFDVPEPLLVFERTLDRQRLLCAFNLGAEPRRFSVNDTELALDGLEYSIAPMR
jgi:alpha-glucosidase